MELSPYLNFAGTCRQAFTFYQQCLGGELTMQTHGDSPMKEHVPAEWHDAILHAQLLADGARLMGSDAPPDRYEKPQGTSVSLILADAAEGERIFTALAEGGTVTMPFGATFWSPGFGMLIDRFGTPWLVNVEAPSA